jgi:hypothetical protein
VSVGVDEEDVDNAARIRGNFFLEEQVRTRATGGGDSDGDDAQSKIEGGEDRLLKIEWRGILKLRRHRHWASMMSSPGSDHSQSPVFGTKSCSRIRRVRIDSNSADKLLHRFQSVPRPSRLTVRAMNCPTRLNNYPSRTCQIGGPPVGEPIRDHGLTIVRRS